MAKLSTAVVGFIRNVFSRDEKVREQLSISKSDLLRSQQMGGAMPDAGGYGFNDMAEALNIDQRLLYRYSDYEQMDDYPDINSTLDIYSDDATQVDSESRKTVWIECQNEEIKVDLEDVFHKRIKIEEGAWEMTRMTCKYGNDFEEIIVGEQGVIGLNYMPPATVRRIQGNRGALKGFVQSYSADMQIDPATFDKIKADQGKALSKRSDMAVFEDWRVVHFRLRSKNRSSVYGWGIGEPARWVWKRLTLLEDAVMVYKLTRSPSRYAFYVDVGNMPRKEAERALQETKQKIKKKKFVNPKTGKLDFRFNPLAFDEDFFLGVRDGKESVRVDMLNGPAYQQVEDVQYFLYKLYAALKIPRAYLGYDENMPSKATLSQEDVRFARTVLRVQREMRNGFHKIGRVHLAARRIDPATVDFNIMMTVPSSIFELGQMEVRRTRAEIASSMERHVSLYWLLSNVYGMSDDEIQAVMKQKEDETKKAQKSGAEGGGGMGFESFEREGGQLVYRPKWPGSQISERELMTGHREHESRVEDIVKREIEKSHSRMGQQIRESSMLLREIAEAVRGRAA